MSEFYRQLRAVSFTAGGNTGDQLETSIIEPVMEDETVYVRELQFRLNGSVTTTAAGQANFAKAIAAIKLEIPGVGELVSSVSGNKLVRQYRERNRGEYPPASATAASTTAIAWDGNNNNVQAGAANVVDFTIPVQFSDPNARRYDDQAIPAVLLRRAKLKVTFGALTDIKADCTAASLTLTVTAVCYRKPELRIGPLPVIDAIDIVGTEPVISPCEGKITHLLIQPQADDLWANGTDYAAAGVSFGSYKMSEDATATDVFYDRFNMIATTDVVKHTASQLQRTQFLPVVFPPDGRQGQHVTYEAIRPGAKPRIKTTAAAAAAGYSVVRRYLLDNRSPAMQKARALCGISNPEPKTASKKGTMDASVAAFVPMKAQ